MFGIRSKKKTAKICAQHEVGHVVAFLAATNYALIDAKVTMEVKDKDTASCWASTPKGTDNHTKKLVTLGGLAAEHIYQGKTDDLASLHIDFDGYKELGGTGRTLKADLNETATLLKINKKVMDCLVDMLLETKTVNAEGNDYYELNINDGLFRV